MPLHGLSDLFLETVGGTHRWLCKVQVFNGGVFLQDITTLVDGGSISVDETREIRRTGTLTVSGQTVLVPFDLSDLLNPASSNEIYVWRGVQYPPAPVTIWQSATTTGSVLTMGTDGNLILSNSMGASVWSSATSGNAGAYLVLGNQGELVVVSSTGVPLWGEPTAYVPDGPAGLTILGSGDQLALGQSISSPNGQVTLTLQTNGNLVETQLTTESEFAQLGVFRMTKPTIIDDGATISITVNLQDRASVIARIDWQGPYVVAAGDDMAGAIEAAMDSRYPGLSYNFATVLDGSGNPFSYPATTWGSDPSSKGDPMSDFIAFAATAAYELFFDVAGTPTLRPIVNPTTSTIVDSIHFVDGANCTMDSAGRTLDETSAYNGVILYCQGTGTAGPFTVEVWDTNPDSPTYYLGEWGQVPYKITTVQIPSGSDTLSVAEAKAEAMAYGQLQLILGVFDDVNLTTVPNPALREGDCTQVTHPRLKIDDAYVISTMTIPLDPETDQAISFRPRISATP